jgi:hypothetical protein
MAQCNIPEDEFIQAGSPIVGHDGGQLGLTASGGQVDESPVQVSAMSHSPAAALQTVVLVR